MPRLTTTAYLALTEKAKILNLRKQNKPSVMLTPTNLIIKHLYRRGLWSSSTLKSYAYRFKTNSIQLRKIAIQAPKIEGLFYYPTAKCDIIIYPSLPGINLSTLISQHKFEGLEAFPRFIAHLHQKGIMFRDLHLANVLYHEGGFSLIDVVCVTFSKNPLSVRKRAKNLACMFSKEDQVCLWNEDRVQFFLEAYILLAQFTTNQKKDFLKHFKHIIFKKGSFYNLPEKFL